MPSLQLTSYHSLLTAVRRRCLCSKYPSVHVPSDDAHGLSVAQVAPGYPRCHDRQPLCRILTQPLAVHSPSPPRSRGLRVLPARKGVRNMGPCTAAVHTHNVCCSPAGGQAAARMVRAGRPGAGCQAHVLPPGGAAGSPPGPSRSRGRATPVAAALRRRGCLAAPWHSHGASPPLPARCLPAHVEGGSQRRSGSNGAARRSAARR